MGSAIVAGLQAAVLAVIAKLFTQAFFESVVSRIVVWGLVALSRLTTNTVDDSIAQDAAKRLGVRVDKPLSGKIVKAGA